MVRCNIRLIIVNKLCDVTDLLLSLWSLTVLKSPGLAWHPAEPHWCAVLCRHLLPSPLSLKWAHKTSFPWQKYQHNAQWQIKGVLYPLPQLGIFTSVLSIPMSWTLWIWKSSPPSFPLGNAWEAKAFWALQRILDTQRAEREESAVVFFHFCSAYLQQVCFAAIQVTLMLSLVTSSSLLSCPSLEYSPTILGMHSAI